MPRDDIPIDGNLSCENSLLSSSAETTASQSLSSNGSRLGSRANWQPSLTTEFNNIAMPSTQSRPLQRPVTNLIDALVSGIKYRASYAFIPTS